MIHLLIIAIIFIVILIIILGIYLYLRKKKIDKQTVLTTSITIKKLMELNKKFPPINISYVHSFKESIYVKKRNDISRFNPNIYFQNSIPTLKNTYIKKMRNQYLYQKYEKLFNQTVENSQTPIEVINSTKLPYIKYKNIEDSCICSLFQRQNDTEVISYTIQAKYVSPKGRSRLYSNPVYYQESLIAEKIDFPPISIDYSPYYENKAEKPSESTNVKDNVKTDECKKDGYLYKIEDGYAYLIEIDPSLEDIIIKNKILIDNQEYKVLLKESSYIGNKKIKLISFEEGIEDIPNFAFKNCTSLENVNFPSTLKTIGKKAFSGCIALKEVRIPEGVTSILEECFSLCSSLTDLYLSSTTKEVGPSIIWYSAKAKIHILFGKDINHFNPEWNVDNNEVIFE